MSRFVAGCVALTLLVAGCGGTTPPAGSAAGGRVLHVMDRVSNAAVVSGANTTDGVTTFSRIVPACGGSVTFVPTADGDYVISVLLDPTGALDAAIERANGNLAAVDTSTMSLPPFWSQTVKGADLPRWIAIGPDGVTVSSNEPATGTVSRPCPSFAPTPLPSAS
ncbi:MAG: hypothetical protein ACJ779_08985 [Chloroflexota bacterium]